MESVSRVPVAGPVVCAVQKSFHDQGRDMAASIAYFSFFSLFPLLLGVVAAASLFVDQDAVEARLDLLLADALPASASFVRENVAALIRLRGAAGLVSAVGLLWAASRMFGAVSRGINGALGQTTDALLLTPVRNFLLMIVVSTLLLLTLSFSTMVELLAGLESGPLEEGLAAFLSFAGGHVASFLIVLMNLAWLYWLVPYERPASLDVLAGALLAATLFELGKTGFLLYLEHVARFEAVYGSVSSIIVLLLWLYFSAYVLLLGAQLMAVRQQGSARPTP